MAEGDSDDHGGRWRGALHLAQVRGPIGIARMFRPSFISHIPNFPPTKGLRQQLAAARDALAAKEAEVEEWRAKERERGAQEVRKGTGSVDLSAHTDLEGTLHACIMHARNTATTQAALHARLTEVQAQRTQAHELLRGVNARLAEALAAKCVRTFTYACSQ